MSLPFPCLEALHTTEEGLGAIPESLAPTPAELGSQELRVGGECARRQATIADHRCVSLLAYNSFTCNRELYCDNQNITIVVTRKNKQTAWKRIITIAVPNISVPVKIKCPSFCESLYVAIDLSLAGKGKENYNTMRISISYLLLIPNQIVDFNQCLRNSLKY